MAKGSAFERKICKMLSLWWTKGDRDDIYWESSNSGGRATIRGKKGRKTFGSYGDVAAVDPIGAPLLELCIVEIKCGYSKCSISDLLDRPTRAKIQQWEKWIAKAMTDRDLAGVPWWLLITKRNQREPIVFMPQDMFDSFDFGLHEWMVPILILGVNVPKTAEPYQEVVGIRLDVWLRATSAGEVKEILKHRKQVRKGVI